MWRSCIFFLGLCGGMAQTLDEDIQQMLENNTFETVENYMEMKLEAHPNDLKTIELVGDIYAHQELWDEAIEHYQILKDAQPNNANYLYKYGGALGMKAASNKLLGIGLIGDVKEALLKAAELDPKHIEVRWVLVKFYVELPSILGGSTQKALQFAHQLSDISPVDGYLAKGFVYKSMADYQQAEIQLKQALEIGGSKTCYLELAQLYLDMGEQEQAAQLLQTGYQTLKDPDILKMLEENR